MRQLMILCETIEHKPLAVIVKGNPKYLRIAAIRPMAAQFYTTIQSILEKNGFRVELDPGKPYTSPDENAEVWIGHSRGIDRLRFAPANIQTIALQTKDHNEKFENYAEQARDPRHYQLSDADIKAITRLKPRSSVS